MWEPPSGGSCCIRTVHAGILVCGVELIRFEQVTHEYRSSSGHARALDAVDLTVDVGRITALLGANGSGKSTLARMCNGLLVPTYGRVTVDGMDVSDSALVRQVRSRVGMVFQNPDDQIVATSVEADVAFGPENLGLPAAELRERVDSALAAVRLTGMESREPHLLSGGQKQRVAIAGALAMLTRYLVMDEPTSMLDPQGRDDVLSIVRSLAESGHGVLLVTHDLAEAMIADDVVVLDQGQVVFSGTAELLLRQEDLAGWGLEMPPYLEYLARLRAGGLDVRADATATDLLEALCR